MMTTLIYLHDGHCTRHDDHVDEHSLSEGSTHKTADTKTHCSGHENDHVSWTKVRAPSPFHMQITSDYLVAGHLAQTSVEDIVTRTGEYEYVA